MSFLIEYTEFTELRLWILPNHVMCFFTKHLYFVVLPQHDAIRANIEYSRLNLCLTKGCFDGQFERVQPSKVLHWNRLRKQRVVRRYDNNNNGRNGSLPGTLSRYSCHWTETRARDRFCRCRRRVGCARPPPGGATWCRSAPRPRRRARDAADTCRRATAEGSWAQPRPDWETEEEDDDADDNNNDNNGYRIRPN